MRSAQAITIASVAQVHAFLGRPPPPHPHLTVIGAPWQPPMVLVAPVEGHRIDSEVYAVSLKRGDECRLAFGRQLHDAQAGTVAFLAPGQTMTSLVPMVAPEMGELAWTLIFHPDLLAQAPLTLGDLSFFRYTSEEALHLTPDEQQTLTELIRSLDVEASRPPDAFANDVIHAQLGLFFAYCRRFYARQFLTRAQVQGGVLTRLQRHLDAYFDSPRPRTEGLPTVTSCARALGYSGDYISDLLREETGHGAREHIHRELIALAKRRLSAPGGRVSDVAHGLGFEHPQHFSKLFKQKTGRSPRDFLWAAASPRSK